MRQIIQAEVTNHFWFSMHCLREVSKSAAFCIARSDRSFPASFSQTYRKLNHPDAVFSCRFGAEAPMGQSMAVFACDAGRVLQKRADTAGFSGIGGRVTSPPLPHRRTPSQAVHGVRAADRPRSSTRSDGRSLGRCPVRVQRFHLPVPAALCAKMNYVFTSSCGDTRFVSCSDTNHRLPNFLPKHWRPAGREGSILQGRDKLARRPRHFSCPQQFRNSIVTGWRSRK
jgi:hypothetical protein